MLIINEDILDLTLLDPKQKHSVIFVRFDGLTEGESVCVHNDHDPKPLYHQLLGERGDVFDWEYLEKGPEWWKVKITRRKSGERDETLGRVAAKDFRKAGVFKKYGLDFCCGGKKTVKDASAEKGLDVDKIEQELLLADQTPVTRPLPYNEWGLDFLADYIVNTHHRYVKKELPDLTEYAGKVAKAHGEKHPELLIINQLVNDINAEMTAHMAKEEKILFPHIKSLVANKGDNSFTPDPGFGTMQNPVWMMEMEHERVGKDLERIRTLSSNYGMPGDACATYSLLYRKLSEFEDDLHLHVHLENNILFPKAVELENK
ncbi:MAG: iron-sulfur cluster repair di-iron protein [Puia sp.]|nr:iron-sulfur cluster repair di-iron protein [Puia sp.]